MSCEGTGKVGCHVIDYWTVVHAAVLAKKYFVLADEKQ